MTRRLITGVFTTLVAVLCVTAFVQGQEGRWKLNGDSCVFDPSDSGPDQCDPSLGRWKVSGDSCVWDANDSGPDQCQPQATE